MYILKIVLDNSITSLIIYEMYGCQCMILKEINIIFVSVIICSIVDSLVITSSWRRRNRYYSALVQKCFLRKETSTYWKLKDKIIKLFKHHSTVVLLYYASPSNQQSVLWLIGVLIVQQHLLEKPQHLVRSIF